MGWDKLREQRYKRMKELGVIDLNMQLSPRNESVPAWEDEKHKAWQERRMEVYAAQVTNMDWNIGRIIKYLKDKGEFDNTLILYQHDNGACHVEYTTTRKGSWSREVTTDGRKLPVQAGNIPGLMPGPQTTFQSYGYGWANVSSTPYRQYKTYNHEGGIKSPLIVSWPDGLAAESKGKLRGDVCHVIDMMPTLLEVAGIDSIEQKPMAFEGRSFMPAFRDKQVATHDAIFWNYAKGKAVRVGDWKLVAAKPSAWELYNLKKDGSELNNLAASMPEKVKTLEALYTAWDKRTNLGRKSGKKK